MLNVGIIGIGNTGNQIAALAKKEYEIPSMAINSSEKDLETIPADVPKYLIEGKEGSSQGAGKNRALAKSYLKNSIIKFLEKKEVQDFILDLDILFIISSCGGGTGSGTAPLLTGIINSTFSDLQTILVGVCPVNSEAMSAHVNTLEYLDELYKSLPKQTYMLYDNDKNSDLPSYKIMDKVNKEIVEDINVIRCKYNLTTRYDSIDEEDMKRLVSFSGRILISRLTNLKEKDIESMSIEDMLIDNIRNNSHVESQRDKKIIASGIILNLSDKLLSSFDNHLPKVREFIGEPIHDFNHIYMNEDRDLPNNVFLVLSGLSPVNDKIHKIEDRVKEIQEKEKENEENAIESISVSGLSKAISSNDVNLHKSDEVTKVDLKDIFSQFGA